MCTEESFKIHNATPFFFMVTLRGGHCYSREHFIGQQFLLNMGVQDESPIFFSICFSKRENYTFPIDRYRTHMDRKLRDCSFNFTWSVRNESLTCP